ncbi:hypothetical protein ACFRMQ_11430 [Kitasatospora sp. NPDC056783]|uniref:hypothetical protein n=1 Tax=Kitasatospora sp. NPDC056783 TaxID=3345943 RepID=UPI0036A5BBD8
MHNAEAVMNSKRAHSAAVALRFAVETGQRDEALALYDEGCFAEVVGDLIANLAHLAASYGHDFEKVISGGMEMYETERRDAEGDA